MSRSQKKRNRREIRRRKKLKGENERIATRQEGRGTVEGVSLRSLIKKYTIELFLVGFVLIGVVFIISLGPDKKAVQKLQESFDPQLYGRSWEWDEAFAQGYKVFVLTETDIIQTSFDTLPEDLKIDWNKISITRIEENQPDGTIEKIKIVINDIHFKSAGISGLSTAAILSRQKGAYTKLASFGELEFVAKIVEDDGSQLFCLLGLRSL